eukprot:3195238-Pleurochrysis_carterae.AAC.1
MLVCVSAQERLKVWRVEVLRAMLSSLSRARARRRGGKGGDGHEERGAKRGGSSTASGGPRVGGCPAA